MNLQPSFQYSLNKQISWENGTKTVYDIYTRVFTWS